MEDAILLGFKMLVFPLNQNMLHCLGLNTKN